MSSSISAFPPVASLCSNCEDAQFRDDAPQLFKAGSHLEFDEKHVPLRKYLGSWRIIPTEFDLVDSFPELPELVRSSQDGCDFCRFLYEAIIFAGNERHIISSTSKQERLISVNISYIWGPCRDDLSNEESFHEWPIGLNAMRITLELSYGMFGSDFICNLDCEVQSLCDSDAVSKWLKLGSQAYPPSYCDADSIRWMNQRLESCKKEHEHGGIDEAYIPKRLIDVSSGVAFLITREEVLQSGCSSRLKYASLSYCWGSARSQAKTTAATLRDRQAGISETEMPPVLRDSIHVTRALGIPFLWIDALCILQDDHSDWEQQCGEMHKIYGSAEFTLCVANSQSCNESFLQQTTPCIQLPFQSHRAPDISGSFLVQNNGHLSTVPTAQGASIESFQLISRDLEKSHWNERGWIFQENKLSTRKLIFGRRNLYFVCDKVHHARGKDVTRVMFGPHIDKILTGRFSKLIYLAWDIYILSKYSKYDASSFSYAPDVLPALSGLAKLFGNRLKDGYYAAHWGRDLYRSLLWEGPRSHSHVMPQAGLIIPSWSRLAKGLTETHIPPSRIKDDTRSEINVPKARVVTVGDNPFGALKECRLWIRGYFLNMSHKEVHVSAEPGEPRTQGRWHLVVHGCCFGHLTFDSQAGLEDSYKICPSADDVKELKLLLLESFEESVSKEVSKYKEGEVFSIANSGGLVQKDKGGEIYKSGDDKGKGCEKSCSQEQASIDKEPALSKDISGHRQCRIRIRRGYGLIISPTGNDGEFRRVGAIFAGIGSHECRPHGDGNLKELQGLAQIETVQLV